MRENKGVGGTLPIPETGLAPDYINVWIGRWGPHNPEKGYDHISIDLGRLKGPIKSYETYFRENYSDWAEDILERSDSRAVSKINKLVSEYNELTEEERLDDEIFNRYYDQVDVLVRGAKK